MPQDLLSDILSTLKADQERKKQRFEQDIKFKEDQRVNEANIQHQKAEEAHQKEQIRLADQQHKEQTRQFDLVQKATKAFNDLKLVSEKNKIIETVRGGGEVAGDVKSPISKSPEGNDYTPASGIGNTDLTQHSIPIGDENLTFASPSAKTVATQEGELEGLRNKPKYEQELSKINAQKQFELLKSAYDQGEQNTRQDRLLKSQQDIAKGRNATTLEAARLRAAGDNSLLNIDPTTFHDRLYNGDATEKQILAEFPDAKSKKAGGQLIRAFTMSNGSPLSDLQQKALSNYQSFADIMKKYDEFLEKAPKVDGEGMLSSGEAALAGMLSNLNQSSASTKQQQLEGHAAELAKKLQDQAGSLSDKDIAFEIKGALPNVSNKFSKNVELRNGLARTIINKFNGDFQNIPVERREVMKAKIGLDKLSQFYKDKVAKKVKLLAPNGETRDVDESEADAYIQRGAKRVQ